MMLNPLKGFKWLDSILLRRLRRAFSNIVEEWRFRQAARQLDFLVPRVHYGRLGTAIGGPTFKAQKLDQYFPHHQYGYNLIYTVNRTVPAEICRRAKEYGVKVVYNADGVLYGAYYPEKRWRSVNDQLYQTYEQADYIFFQSKFAQLSTEHFLGEPKAPHEILYNAVDTDIFKPPEQEFKSSFITLLTTGFHRLRYRLEVVVRMTALLKKRELPNVRLVIAGRLGQGDGIWDVEKPIHALVERLDLSDSVIFLPAYSQQEAPQIYQAADVFVHAQWNDTCPSVVIEAMACGLPVVYSNSGGTPELVGNAGIGVSSRMSWEEIQIPSYKEFAASVIQVLDRRTEFSKRARERAVHFFNIQDWIKRHRQIFEALLKGEDCLALRR
jgi:glycosyltransferase involved in cell wall biosynthesis